MTLRGQGSWCRRWLGNAVGSLPVVCASLLLFVFAQLTLADPPLPIIPATNFNITSFGAFGDGVSNNATAIQNTINAASAAGGGTVVVAAVGVLTNYLSGPISLTNKVSLQVNAGTKLQMLPWANWPGSTTFINGSTLHDVEINGSGTIDGNAGLSTGGVTNNWWQSGGSSSQISRPNFINFSGCTRVLVQGVTLQNPPTFHIMAKGNNVNLTIQNIFENTIGTSPNTDGMDIGSSNVLVRNCTINVGDDNIEIGGSTALVADMTVSNCSFGTGHGVSLGSQVNGAGGGVRNLLVSNCTFNGTDNGIRMKTDRDRGGPCQDMKFLDITMTNVVNPIIMYGYYTSIGTPTNITPFGASTDTVHTVTSQTPQWRNITISNLTASADSGLGIVGILWGVPEMLISNVTFCNVNFAAPKTFCIYNAQAIRFIDSQIAAPSGTNTLTLYNADVIITNSVANTNLVTVGGLATPPTNNTLAFFNAQAAITESNVLGAAPITLGGSTLTFTPNSVSFSNTFNVASTSWLVLPNGTSTMSSALSGPGPLAVVLTNSGNLRFDQGVNVWGGTNAAFDAGASGTINNHSDGNIIIFLGALSGGAGSKLAGSDQLGPAVDTYVVGGLNSNTTFSGVIADGNAAPSHAVALTKIGAGAFTLSNFNTHTGGTTVSNGTLLVAGTTGYGTLTVVGGSTCTFSSSLSISIVGTSTVWLTGGLLNVSGSTSVGKNFVGRMIVSNGTWLADAAVVGDGLGSSGTLTIAGGTNSLVSKLQLAASSGTTGAVWLTGGQLSTTNETIVGENGAAQMTISNGTWTAGNVYLARSGSSSQGTLTIAGGTTTLSSSLAVNNNGTGTLWLTGGQLSVINGPTTIGAPAGVGRMIVSNGTWLGQIVDVGTGSQGTLTIAGGTNTSFYLFVGESSGGSGTVWLTGGFLSANNSEVGRLGGRGQMTISNGTFLTSSVYLGTFLDIGTLTVVGGTSTVDGSVTLGVPDCSATGVVIVAGGRLDVTNSSGTAVLNVENGTLTLNSGTLTVNKFVLTNACGHFSRTGGTLIYSNAVLNPAADTDGDGIPNGYELAHGLDPLNPADAGLDNDGDGFSNLQEYLAGTDPNNPNSTPFHIAAVAQQGSNMLLSWTTFGGTTNQVQVTGGLPGGGYATNGFANLGPQLLIGGSGLVTTNYLDVNGATNSPSRYYRIRLIP